MGDRAYLQNSVRICGSSWSTCGYCRGDRSSLVNRNPTESSKAYTVLADSLTPDVYEAFLNEGWRRSGRALYRPDNWVSCCPAMTIRLQVDKFQPTKSQRKLRRQAQAMFNKEEASVSSTKNNPHESNRKPVLEESWKELHRSGFIDDLRDRTAKALQSKLGDGVLLPNVAFKVLPRRRHSNSQSLTLSTAICATIAGRSRGAIARNVLAKGVVDELVRIYSPVGDSKDGEKHPEPARLASSETSPTMGSVAHKKLKSNSFKVVPLSIELHEASGQILVHVRVDSTVDDASTAETYMKHDSDLSNESSEQNQGGNHQHKDKLAAWWSRHHRSEGPADQSFDLEITTLPAHESALLPDVHRLYMLYQHKVHDDPDPFDESVSRKESGDISYAWAEKAPPGFLERAKAMLHDGYKDTPHLSRVTEAYGQFYSFLVDSPLITSDTVGSRDSLALGTYHQLYRVRGMLVAVGVVDVLPQGLSSVYLFYDPSFSRDVLALGKYATLMEIDWTLENKLPFYYLGYYIDSCPKMRYKADYHPSELLCPATKRWVDAEDAKSTITAMSPTQTCCALYRNVDADKTDSDEPQLTASHVRLEVGMGQPASVDMLVGRGQALVRPIVEEFIREAGPRIAPLCAINLV